MINYTFTKIFHSLISALIYGGIFPFFCTMCRITRLYFGMIISAIYDAFFCRGRFFSKPDLYKFNKQRRSSRFLSELSAFFLVVLFFIGIIFLSYLTLDGDIRVYLVIIAFFAFLLSEKLLSRFLIKILCVGFEMFLYVFTVILRIIILPFKIILSFLSKILHKTSILTKITPFTTLDNRTR